MARAVDLFPRFEPMSARATLHVDGPGQLLRAFRKRLVESMRDEACGATLTETRRDGRLEFAMTASGGIPFPPLVAASILYPDCVVTLNWEIDGALGETTLRNGQASTASQGGVPAGLRDRPGYLSLRDDGSLLLGLALAPTTSADRVLGYAATHDAETWFLATRHGPSHALWSTGGDASAWDEHWIPAPDGKWQCVAVAHPEPISPDILAQLTGIADAVRADALWYDHAAPEDTIIERQRAAAAARPLHAINVKSRIVAMVAAAGEHDRLDAGDRWVADLIRETWAAPGTTP